MLGSVDGLPKRHKPLPSGARHHRKEAQTLPSGARRHRKKAQMCPRELVAIAKRHRCALGSSSSSQKGTDVPSGARRHRKKAQMCPRELVAIAKRHRRALGSSSPSQKGTDVPSGARRELSGAQLCPYEAFYAILRISPHPARTTSAKMRGLRAPGTAGVGRHPFLPPRPSITRVASVPSPLPTMSLRYSRP